MNTTGIRFASNRICDVERLYHEELDSIYGTGEVGMMVRMLFEAWMGWSHAELLTRRDETINQSELLRFHWALEDLRRHRPIQHIIGWTEFAGCCIEVDESTLIPRPETEEMVLETIKLFAEKPPHKVLDLCTGSGCIAIALAEAWPEADITGVDISDKALEKARKNAEINSVKTTFLQGDLLSDDIPLPYPVDLIISNPPYVCDRERAAMQSNVIDYEPATALFVPDNDPLIFYRRIAELGRTKLCNGGTIVLEINERFGEETLSVMEQQGFHGRVENDFRGKKRIIVAKKTQ